MCGIAGQINFDGSPVDPCLLQRMNRSVAHRGPDGEGLWTSAYVGLAHRRLAIRDLSEAGHQPMLDADHRVCVTYNGEIYNYTELRQLLEKETGYIFRSTCDAELLPIGWITWGEKLFDKIEGMFALAIWDTRDETLVLARDSVGIKPLFYFEDKNSLYFCSEIKGILATNKVPCEINPAAFHTYLAAGYTNPNDSLIQGIKQLLPGSILRCSHRQVPQSYFYWKPQRNPIRMRLEDAALELEALLKKIISEMLVSDVPLGLLQSSGIDSTLIALLTNNNVESFTAKFDERSHDETHLAEKIARFSHHPWHSISVQKERTLVDDFHSVAHYVDGQLADSSCLAHFALSRATRQHVTVALAGDGADEIFAGYPTYRASYIASMVAPIIPGSLSLRLGNWLFEQFGQDERRLPWHEVLRRFLWGIASSSCTQHAQWRRLTPANLLPTLYDQALQPFLSIDPLAYYNNTIISHNGKLFDRCLLGDQSVYLPGDMLAKVDRMSMAHGLEVRVPFLDRRLINFASQLPRKLLNPLPGPSKRILRHIVKSHSLPSEISKGKKKGFNVPLAGWLRRDLFSIGEEILMKNTDIFSPLLKTDRIRQVWQEHCQGKYNHSYMIWALLIYGSWRQREGYTSC